jgi:tripeptidyl-peptidase-1
MFLRYGQHLSKAELAALVEPQTESIMAVKSWLHQHNVVFSDNITLSSASGWLNIRLSVSQAEQLLNATYGRYYHSASSSYTVRTLSYALPHSVHPHVGRRGADDVFWAAKYKTYENSLHTRA